MPAKKKPASKVTPSKIASLTVSRMELSDLAPHPRNSEIRKHPEKGSARWNTLTKSLEHDYFDPIVYNERNGFLVSGHLRLKVMTEIGFTSADVVVVDYDEPTHIARMLAANRTMGDDDIAGQKSFFEEIKGAGLSLDLTGFDVDAIAGLDLLVDEEEDPENSTSDKTPKDIDKRLLACCAFIEDPKTEVHRGDYWFMGDRIHLFVGSLIDPTGWASVLGELVNDYGDEVRFMACPDPYMALADSEHILVLVQPDVFVAGHIVSNWNKANPKSKATKQ